MRQTVTYILIRDLWVRLLPVSSIYNIHDVLFTLPINKILPELDLVAKNARSVEPSPRRDEHSPACAIFLIIDRCNPSLSGAGPREKIGVVSRYNSQLRV